MLVEQLLWQALKAAGYYAGLIVLMRLAGKRLAGQTTTFDLIVLITLGVVLQSTALEEGTANALVFVGTVFFLHRSIALLCARFTVIRHAIRGRPRQLICDGSIIESALVEESISRSELLAGPRKLGHEDVTRIKTATLEETGHISAVEK